MSANRKYSSIRSGFTLIELLVVIAIIAILAAILFPVFASAREKARQATCASNEKQFGIAFQEYNQDYDELYPIGSENAAPFNEWDVLISPYIMKTIYFSPAVYHCPDDLSASNSRTYAMNDANGLGSFGLGPAGWFISGVAYPCPLSAIGTPSNTFLLVENPHPGNFVTQSSYAQVGCPVSATGYTCQDSSNVGNPLHTGGWNYLYCDGHVKWLRPEMTFRTPGVTYPVATPSPKFNDDPPTWIYNCPGTGNRAMRALDDY